MDENLSFFWKNMKMLLLDEAFHYLYAHLFGGAVSSLAV